LKTASFYAELVCACLYALFYLPILPFKLAHTYWNKYKSKDGLLAVIVVEVSYALIGWGLIAKLF
jgi:hypothetical protein